MILQAQSVTCRTPGLAVELERCDYRAQVVLGLLATKAGAYDCDVQITNIERTPAQTRAIYERAGRKPPASSVHDVRPCRGIDCIPVLRPLAKGGLEAIGQVIADEVNELVRYPRGLSAVIWHSIGAGIHWHIQVPWDDLALRAPAEGNF